MLRTEADVVRALSGCVTVEDIYAACERETDVQRAQGARPVGPRHGSDQVWKRRARGALQSLKTQGRARRVGRGAWLLNHPGERATVYLLISADANLRDVELRVQEACELMANLGEPADLVLTDPPYGLLRDGERSSALRLYRRDRDRVIGGYVDVPAEAYMEFTRQWVSRASAALRPGGQLVVVTGPQRAAHVQIAAEESALTWVASVVAERVFPLYHRRRPAPAHWTITCMSNGPLYEPSRVFNPPSWQRAKSGRLYPLDWWQGNGRSDRPDALRYDNALPEPLAERLVQAFSDPGQLVCDPFVGSGTVMLACVRGERRFLGGDVNPAAVRFAAARLLDEHPQLADTPRAALAAG